MYHQLEFEGGSQIGQLISGAFFDGGSEEKSETAALSMPNLEESGDDCGLWDLSADQFQRGEESNAPL